MAKGRLTKLTAEVQQRICDALRTGNFLDTAAAYAGVEKTTLHAWLRRGRRASGGVYREFASAVDRALAQAEARDVALIAKAASEGSWQAAAWRLERRFSERWSRREQHKVEAQVKGSVEISADDAVQELARLLAARPA